MLPTSAEPLVFQGFCYDKMGQQSKAEAAWRDAVRVAPDASEPHYRLGRQEMDHGHPTAAIDHFRKAIAKMPANASWESELYFQLGQAELLTGSKSGALAAFKKYVELAPPDAPSRPEALRQVARLSSK
jgi:tetratricopeptide (TPR) repeat protein